MADVHVLCCDCDTCLNGSGGLVLPGAGVVLVDEAEAAARRSGLAAVEHQRRQWREYGKRKRQRERLGAERRSTHG